MDKNIIGGQQPSANKVRDNYLNLQLGKSILSFTKK